MVKSKAKPKKEKFLKDINSKLKSDKKKKWTKTKSGEGSNFENTYRTEIRYEKHATLSQRSQKANRYQ